MSADEPLPPSPTPPSDDAEGHASAVRSSVPPSGGAPDRSADSSGDRDDASGARRPRTPRADPLIGKLLDERYRVLSLIAKGGMGRVYRAEQAPFGRVVAVKVLDVGDEDDDDQEFRRRFVREAEVCARLSHPNTVRVFDYGRADDDVLYIAMEHLEGRNLFQAIQTDAPMDALRVVRIGRQVASSLREAHALGLIHRDLKPSNIILTRPGGDDEFVKVVDFGLAKEIRADSELTRGDALVGSPSYMSPEQVRSDALDERSDVYSLGVLLYACLCGRPPFTGSAPLNVLMGHLNHAPPPMEAVCPSMVRVPSLEAVVLRCLAKSPADRYAGMDALLQALQGVQDELSGITRPSPLLPPTRFRPPAPVIPPDVPLVLEGAGPSRGLVAGIVGAVLLAAALGAWWLFQPDTRPGVVDDPIPLGAGGSGSTRPGVGAVRPGSDGGAPLGGTGGGPGSGVGGPDPGARADDGPPATPPPAMSAPPPAAAPATPPTPTPAAAAPTPVAAPTPPASPASPAPSAPPAGARPRGGPSAPGTSPTSKPSDSADAPGGPSSTSPPPSKGSAGSDVRDPWAER